MRFRDKTHHSIIVELFTGGTFLISLYVNVLLCFKNKMQ